MVLLGLDPTVAQALVPAIEAARLVPEARAADAEGAEDRCRGAALVFLAGDGDEQVAQAAYTLSLLAPNFMSINEMQYDKPDIPRNGVPGTGKNVERLAAQAALTGTWHTSFAEALTGRHARKQDGAYVDNPNSPAGRELGVVVRLEHVARDDSQEAVQ